MTIKPSPPQTRTYAQVVRNGLPGPGPALRAPARRATATTAAGNPTSFFERGTVAPPAFVPGRGQNASAGRPNGGRMTTMAVGEEDGTGAPRFITLSVGEDDGSASSTTPCAEAPTEPPSTPASSERVPATDEGDAPITTMAIGEEDGGAPSGEAFSIGDLASWPENPDTAGTTPARNAATIRTNAPPPSIDDDKKSA